LQVSGAAGTSGQVLTSAGTGAVPTWTTPSGGGGASAITISAKTGAYTVVAGDLGTIINCTSGTFTVSLTAAATLGSGFNCWIWNTSTTATDAITIDPNASETIDGRTTRILRRGEGMQIVCDGTNFQTGNKKTMRGYAENISVGQSPPTASGDLAIAIGVDVTASSTSSTAIGNNSGGGGSQAVTGSGAMALGGSYASGSNSFAAGIANNTSTYGAQGTNSVAIGLNAIATGVRGLAIGRNCSSSNTGSLAIGSDSTSSATSSVAIGGATATAIGAIALGVSQSSIINKYTLAGGFNSAFAATGDAQTGTFVLRAATTSTTATVLTTNESTAAATNQIILPNNSAYAFQGTVVARQQASGGTASAAWKIEGLIRREGTAASTTLVFSTAVAISNVPLWTLALSADTTNGGLKIEATGAAATNIRWVATINTSEVTY
jgi:hypothetical protein